MSKLTVEDRLEILELYARYSHTIDSGDDKGWAACFTSDGHWSSGSLVLKGPERLAKFAKNSLAFFGAFRHVQTNICFEPTEEGAEGSAYLMFMRPNAVGGPPDILSTAIYRDRLVRTADGWRFASRASDVDTIPVLAEDEPGNGLPSRRFRDVLGLLEVTVIADNPTIENQRSISMPEFDTGDTTFEEVTAGPVPAEWVDSGGSERTILYLHGGGFISGTPRHCRCVTVFLSRAAKARVLTIDYRLAPENPFPAAYEDALASYRWLVTEGGIDPAHLSVVGDSAGGGLAVAMLMGARDAGLPLPACTVIYSSVCDWSLSNPSLDDAGRDPYVTRELLQFMASNYLAGADSRDPRCSPVYGDLSGLPPALVMVGEAEILYDDSSRLATAAKAAGVDTTFEPWPHMAHIWPYFTPFGVPESQQAIDRMAGFILGHSA